MSKEDKTLDLSGKAESLENDSCETFPNKEDNQSLKDNVVSCETSVSHETSNLSEKDNTNQSKSSVARSAAIMGIATFLSRIAGLIREQTFAYLFGAGKWTDAFNVAFKIPNLLRDLFAEGAMSAAFVPTFNGILQKEGQEKAFRLTNLTFCAILIIVGTLTAIGMILSPYIVQILAPQFVEDPEKFAVTVTMTRIMFPFLLVISWAAISMGMLNSLGEFFIPSVAPVFLNLSMILSGWLICPLTVKFNMPAITGMAIGAMLGGILQFTCQLPSLIKKGWKFFWCLDFKDEGIRKIGKLMIPGTIGLAATQINVAISTILATSQGDGAVSWISYAFRIMQLPIGIFGVAVAQATLPVISRQAASGDKDAMAGTLASSIRLSAYINLWACFACIALAEPVIRIIYQHGRFGVADTLATTAVLRAYSIGLVFYALIKILGPAFYALEDTKVPVKASIISIVVSIILSLALIKPFGYISLPFSSSVAAIVNAGFLFFILQKRVGGFGKYSLISGLIKIIIATAVSGVATYYSYIGFCGYMGSVLPNYGAGTFVNSSVSMCVGGISGLIALYVVSRLMHIEEADRAAELVLRKFFKKRNK